MFAFHLELEFAEPKFRRKRLNSLEIFFMISTDISRELYLTIGEMFQDVTCISPKALTSINDKAGVE